MEMQRTKGWKRGPREKDAVQCSRKCCAVSCRNNFAGATTGAASGIDLAVSRPTGLVGRVWGTRAAATRLECLRLPVPAQRCFPGKRYLCPDGGGFSNRGCDELWLGFECGAGLESLERYLRHSAHHALLDCHRSNQRFSSIRCLHLGPNVSTDHARIKGPCSHHQSQLSTSPVGPSLS